MAEFSSTGVLQPTVTPNAVVATSGSVFPVTPLFVSRTATMSLGQFVGDGSKGTADKLNQIMRSPKQAP